MACCIRPGPQLIALNCFLQIGINFIVNSVDPKYKVFSDLPACEAAGGGTIPADLCVTNLKPDIVIIDNEKKILHIFELTIPLYIYIFQVVLVQQKYKATSSMPLYSG